MRKQVFGRKLKRDANERKALFKGLLNDLVLKERIQTTEAKAKSIKGQAEKLVTKAKVKGDAARTVLQSYLVPTAIEKVVMDLAVRFATRPGGYTRLIRLGKRFGDNAPMVVLEWVEKKEEAKADKPEAVIASEAKQPSSKSAKKTAKKEVKTEKKTTKKTK